MSYITGPKTSGGCVFCDALSGSDDRKSLLLARRDQDVQKLNRYPYAAGHLMAVINRHVGTLPEAATGEMTGAMELVSLAISILSAEYRPEGFASASIKAASPAPASSTTCTPRRPRWNGDNAFISVVGVRVPEALETTYDRLKGRLGD